MFVLCIHLAKKRFLPVYKNIALYCFSPSRNLLLVSITISEEQTNLSAGALALHSPGLTVPSFDSELLKPLCV